MGTENEQMQAVGESKTERDRALEGPSAERL